MKFIPHTFNDVARTLSEGFEDGTITVEAENEPSHAPAMTGGLLRSPGLSFWGRTFYDLLMSSFYGASTGAVLLFLLWLKGAEIPPMNLRFETFYLLLSLPGMAISQLFLSSAFYLRLRLNRLRSMRNRHLISRRQYAFATQQILDWYTATTYSAGRGDLMSYQSGKTDLLIEREERKLRS